MSDSNAPRTSASRPFPVFEVNGLDVWEFDFLLPSWAGFQTRRGSYDSLSRREPSDGTVTIRVKLPKWDEPPSSEQSEAFQFLKDNEEQIAANVLEAIWEYYGSLPERYGFDKRQTAKHFRAIRRDGFRNLIGLGTVHVLNVAKDGVAYIGFEFGCVWDGEHGMGVMTHKDRVVDIGGADTSLNHLESSHVSRTRRAHTLPSANAKLSHLSGDAGSNWHSQSGF